MFVVPPEFVRTQTEIHGPAGRAWLARLPGILDACARRWALTLGPAFPNLSYHYVAPAVRADGTAVVVKVCSPTGEFASESAALRCYDGQGATRLLAADSEREVMLLERLLPGTLLSTVSDDEEATVSAAGVMRALWRPVPPDHPFPTVADWGAGFARLRQRFGGGTGPFPAALVATAERLFATLDASASTPVVLHGDLHHGNILAAGPRGWLAIDPKGLVGEPAYEAGALLRNPLPWLLAQPDPASILARRLDILSSVLVCDRARLRGWGIAQAVLSAWWSFEDHGHGWEPAIACAELLAAPGRVESKE
jgi:streptomycin 6-kinase